MSLYQGKAVEKRAKQYLIDQGMVFVTNNYYCPFGEIDLIMREQAYFVFVEVRARTSLKYGGALASVTLSKQKKIAKTALHYMVINKLFEKYPIRFDVLSAQGNPLHFELIKNAFSA